MSSRSKKLEKGNRDRNQSPNKQSVLATAITKQEFKKEEIRQKTNDLPHVNAKYGGRTNSYFGSKHEKTKDNQHTSDKYKTSVGKTVKTTAASSASSSTSKQFQDALLKTNIFESGKLNNSFRIPKTVEKVKKNEDCSSSISFMSSTHSPSSASKTSPSLVPNMNQNSRVISSPSYEYTRTTKVTSPMILQDVEEMDWENTFQEIKSLWPGSNSFTTKNASTTSASDVDKDINDMEIDFDSTLTNESQLIIVPDTNIWIHSLSFIQGILDTKFPDLSLPVIVIPWMALQELDISGKSTGRPGCQAIRYIHSLLRTNHPRVKGQKASDAAVVHPHFDKRNADDSIIQCALQQQKSNTIVILLTNDKNMANKAIVNKILTADVSIGAPGIMDLIQTNSSGSYFSAPLSPIKTYPEVNMATVPETDFKSNVFCDQSSKAIPVKASPSRVSNKNGKRQYAQALSDEAKKRKDDKDDVRLPAESFRDLLALIQQTLSHVIEIKMKEDYGDPGWLKAIKIPPPWTLKSAVECIVKHWLAVFSEVFGRRVGLAEKLLEYINHYQNGILTNASNMYEDEIIEQVLGLFAAGEFSLSDIVREDSKVKACWNSLLEYTEAKKGADLS